MPIKKMRSGLGHQQGSIWADALEQMNDNEDFIQMMNSVLKLGDGGLIAFSLEGMIKEWLESQRPEDDKGL